MAPKEATGRFYFECTQILMKEDITKFNEVVKLPLYLCLNSLARHKENIEKENERIRKEQEKWKSTSVYRR